MSRGGPHQQRGMCFLWKNITGPKLVKRILLPSWVFPNGPLLLPGTHLTLLSPLGAWDRPSLKLTFPPSPRVGCKVRMGSFVLNSNKPPARALMSSFSPSGTVCVPATLPFAQTSEEGAVALMWKLGSQSGRECRFSTALRAAYISQTAGQFQALCSALFYTGPVRGHCHFTDDKTEAWKSQGTYPHTEDIQLLSRGAGT